MPVLNFLYSVKYYFRWIVVGLILSTISICISPYRFLNILISFTTLMLAYLSCGETMYRIGMDLNATISLFDKKAQESYKYTMSHCLIFAGGFWVPCYLIVFFLNLRIFLINLVGNIVSINQIIL